MKRILIIYGPTGSGKTQLANLIAYANNAHIINADSIQVYDKIKILNASPSDSDKQLAHHSLFNFFPVYKNYSLDLYIKDIKRVLNNSGTENYVLVGGTGMYINTILNGMRIIQDIEPKIRNDIREKFVELGNEKFYQELANLDPKIIGKIHLNNSHRLIRAYEIKESTGYSVYDSDSLSNQESVISGYKIVKIYLNPTREFLYEICNNRFDNMIKNGAMEEVQNIAQGYDELSLSVKKIIGLEELYGYINNRTNLVDAISEAKKRTRNYAKRQYTWFSNQIKHNFQVEFASLKEYENQINNLTKSYNEFFI